MALISSFISFQQNGKIWFKWKDSKNFWSLNVSYKELLQRVSSNLVKHTWFNISLQVQWLKGKTILCKMRLPEPFKNSWRCILLKMEGAVSATPINRYRWQQDSRSQDAPTPEADVALTQEWALWHFRTWSPLGLTAIGRKPAADRAPAPWHEGSRLAPAPGPTPSCQSPLG